MRVLRTAGEMESWLDGLGWASSGGPVVVPTMGALHLGHASLVERGAAIARERGTRAGCVVWVFVNPTQFNDRSDLDRYPRTLESDVGLSERCGASAVFAPDADVVYPPGVEIDIPALPAVATEPGLEDRFRPGHFAGVCQVVKRFFGLMRPSVAIFGEKDWQQLQVVRAMVAQECLDVEIRPSPTVRESDGLAMSSRNRFLDRADRDKALSLHAALVAASQAESVGDAEHAMQDVLRSRGVEVEYAVVREAETLKVEEPWKRREAGGSRALIAARVGAVRLIDNCDWLSGP
ncbi:MAG: pantoate--beta-alanine ligase [Phycisphaeraceae bacterium]|nr:MAG: pantoate--beta-alanine ligase [Phycisphaeraceae bacterium]